MMDRGVVTGCRGLSPLRGFSGSLTHHLRGGLHSFAASWLTLITGLAVLLIAIPAGWSQAGQSQGQNQGQSQQPAQSQESQDIPDAPSTVQPPQPKPAPEAETAPASDQSQEEAAPGESSSQENREQTAPPPMPPVQTLPPSKVPPQDEATGPKNQINPTEPLFKLRVQTNFVQIPVLVRDSQGRRVDGLTHRDFTVKENGKPQTLTYFTSDPFPLSVALVLDIGMPDIALQKVNQTYASLVGAFSPYDEVALYTYSSTVSQASDFTARTQRLTAVLDEMKLVRGHNNGPPVLGGPLGPQPPEVNGIPVGTAGPPPVYTPPKEAYVLNDAILRAALDLSKRPRGMRKVIFVISDGREYGSQASYKEVLKLLQTRNIQVKAVVVDQGALPIYKQIQRFHLKGQGFDNILPKYVYATCGGQVYSELSRNSIEDAYAQITSEARNQYTLGYVPKPSADSSAYRSIEVIVHRRGLKVSAKDGYYRVAMPRQSVAP
ncbi:MAG TPA: VWA domain-containing protein [Candidatus Sulfotelmatobacter sp.]|nr:VWA domain-containing protein [Candidatus Sulfotelmatobacter sp.]